MDDKIKEKIDNYKRLSNLYFNALTFSAGGFGGLLLVKFSLKIAVLLLITGGLIIFCTLRHQYCNEIVNDLINKG